ncbi:MAG: hypothetical protein EOM41_08125 [Bacilli bacterium]|nr:hypothetical protein [Bacilli bacterium]
MTIGSSQRHGTAGVIYNDDGVAVDDAALQSENEVDAKATNEPQDTGKPVTARVQIKEAKKLNEQFKEVALEDAWYFGRTLSYSYQNPTPMEIEGFDNVRSGKELSEKLMDPAFEKNCKKFFVVRRNKFSGGFNPLDKSTWGFASVYVLFETTEIIDGKPVTVHYATALSNTKTAA